MSTPGFLMANHYHLFIETPEANLVQGMKWFGAEGADARMSHLRRGWYWGREEFANGAL
jgi:hypothetical protein